ncbi:DUF262 domain-containing protein [Bradyrhizobium ottawaense]|uniref:DUF262 domain-containing protein n=1 Tax=Bradyrhizobium ottawaense TaxID=931866 RepID=UPI0027D52722|nr:DUF262 domain-containing protein [Bradyrhizobium ottawaense]GMP03140.1 DUF262 domain-containing protein [Bradyrhizobium ottawaense]GMP03281.1 DUF262 domain-containing protein [Bradyrhizobium ottawaense]GMP15335.1 DUF262 domain-containing protein [Bradyrhizobium ottawaense]
MNIKPAESNIRVMFQSAFYKIPRFQRPYSWDSGNIEEFWTDVLDGPSTGYFIGSMVFYKKGTETFVVDGQQRLTTLTIFLAALRDTLKDIGADSLAKGIQNVIQRKDINDNVDRYVLLTETSYPYFQDQIQNYDEPELDDEPSPEETGMLDAYNFAKGKFADAVANIKAKSSSARQKATQKKLQELRDKLLSLQVITISLDTEEEAYIIFETLNTRGKDLAVEDLLKNHLTRLLPQKSAEVDATRKRWANVVREIAESNANLEMSNYVHHFWLSREDYTPKNTLFKRIKTKVKAANAKQFLLDFEEGVLVYRQIFEPDAFTWSNEMKPVARSLKALLTFRVKQPAPLVFSLLRAHYGSEITLKQLKAALHAIEAFHFQHTAIASLSSSGGISMMYAAAARELFTEANEQKRAKHLQVFRQKLCERIPDPKTFAAQFQELQVSASDTKHRPLIRYILEKIDEHLRGDKVVDYDKMTIEHLAPQNPAGTKPADKVDFSNIGNLIFVSSELNGKLKNSSFTSKKKLLEQNGIPMDDVLAGATSWGQSEIESRAKALAKLASSHIWKP